MKKYVLTVILGVILIITGSVFAALPKYTLNCDGWNCVLHRNFFGQIIQAKYKFTYQDVQRCEVQPVKTRNEEGKIVVKTYTLRLIGDNIKQTPEWINEDPKILSEVCNNFFRRYPVNYSDKGILNILKTIWALFLIGGIYLIMTAKRK